MKSQIYSSFLLGGSEYAIAVEQVREVVHRPEKLTQLPLSPKYLKGVFNLRGMIIPLIDLNQIFVGKENVNSDQAKVAIIENGKFNFGILFDQTNEIFKNNPEELSLFNAEPGQESVISGVFKKDNGQRIIQILNIKTLFELQKIPFQSSEGKSIGQDRTFLQRRGGRKQCITIMVGHSRCAISIDAISEILKVEKINSSALSGSHCLGTIDLRGTTVPVINFSTLLNYQNAEAVIDTNGLDARRIVVMRLGAELFGLLVNSVDSIISYFADDLKAFPVLAQDRVNMFSGIISRSDEDEILLLDHSQIFTHAEIEKITHGHNKIYNSENSLRANAIDKKVKRKTVITFTLEACYAVAIDEVREIIDFPENLIFPPGLPSYFKGVLNLRGDLITIVDARGMYGLPPIESKLSKVMIFKSNGSSFGFVVDQVDSIFSFNENEKMNMPDFLFKNNRLTEDVREAFMMGKGTESTNVLILNTQAIYERIGKAS